jgi:hypothetical protein
MLSYLTLFIRFLSWQRGGTGIILCISSLTYDAHDHMVKGYVCFNPLKPIGNYVSREFNYKFHIILTIYSYYFPEHY